MKRLALSEVKDDLSRVLRLAEDEEVIITRHGKPAGVLVGFRSEDDWFDYRLENDERFLARVESARSSLRAGLGSRLEEVRSNYGGPGTAPGSPGGARTRKQPRPAARRRRQGGGHGR